MNDADVRKLLRDMARGTTQRAVANRLRVNEGQLCDVLKRRRSPGPKLLRALGLERTIVYTRRGQ